MEFLQTGLDMPTHLLHTLVKRTKAGEVRWTHSGGWEGDGTYDEHYSATWNGLAIHLTCHVSSGYQWLEVKWSMHLNGMTVDLLKDKRLKILKRLWEAAKGQALSAEDKAAVTANTKQERELKRAIEAGLKKAAS